VYQRGACINGGRSSTGAFINNYTTVNVQNTGC
jgi:hypothetical protein